MLKKIGLIFVSIVLSLVFSFVLINSYDNIVGFSPNGFFSANYALVLPLIAAVDFMFFFYIFSSKIFYRDKGIAKYLLVLLPFIVIELLIAINFSSHLLFPIVLALLGWILGFALRFGFNKILAKKREL